MPSDLPIISAPDPFERRTTAQKYGSAYYLGIAGLAIVVALVTWFATSVYKLRAVWRDVYVLHDETRSNPDRIQAAWRLAHNPEVTPTQVWEMALRKPVPTLARYILAESLDERIVKSDPRGYALSVAYSKDWPDWLRLLAARPLLEAASDHIPLPEEPIHTLQAASDPVLAAWATATEVLRDGTTPEQKKKALIRLKSVKKTEPRLQSLIIALEDVIRLSADEDHLKRLGAIDGATIWLRSNDSSAREVWQGWSVDGEELKQIAAPELPLKVDPSNPRVEATP